jgi:hypothetical protein
VGGAVKERARGAAEMAGVAVQLLEIDKNTLEFVKLLKLKKKSCIQAKPVNARWAYLFCPIPKLLAKCKLLI